MNVKLAIKTLKKYDCRVKQKSKDLYIVDDCGYNEEELIDLAQSYKGDNYTPIKKKSGPPTASRRKREINLTRDWEDSYDDDFGA